jgi:hypothetical protein
MIPFGDSALFVLLALVLLGVAAIIVAGHP